MPFYEYTEERFFASDGAPPTVAAQRRIGIRPPGRHARVARAADARGERRARARRLRPAVHQAYRVPFQYRRYVARRLRVGSLLEAGAGVTVTNLDGQTDYDVSGLVRRQRLRLRLLQGVHRRRHRPRPEPGARARRRITRSSATTCAGSGRSPGWTRCRFTCPAPKPSCRRCGWRDFTPVARTSSASAAPTTAGGTMCSPGSAIRRPRGRPTRSKDMDAATLQRAGEPARHRVRAGQSAPGAASERGAPADGTLIDSRRRAGIDRAAYAAWLEALRAVCSKRVDRPHLRRGLRRLSDRPRRRAGVFRRARPIW